MRHLGSDPSAMVCKDAKAWILSPGEKQGRASSGIEQMTTTWSVRKPVLIDNIFDANSRYISLEVVEGGKEEEQTVSSRNDHNVSIKTLEKKLSEYKVSFGTAERQLIAVRVKTIPTFGERKVLMEIMLDVLRRWSSTVRQEDVIAELCEESFSPACRKLVVKPSCKTTCCIAVEISKIRCKSKRSVLERKVIEVVTVKHFAVVDTKEGTVPHLPERSETMQWHYHPFAIINQ